MTEAHMPPSVDGTYFLHATAGSRTMLTKDEYDSLVAKLDQLRNGGGTGIAEVTGGAATMEPYAKRTRATAKHK